MCYHHICRGIPASRTGSPSKPVDCAYPCAPTQGSNALRVRTRCVAKLGRSALAQQHRAAGDRAMKIGATFTKDFQRYECIGFTEHESRAGHVSTLHVLRTNCSECGAPFEFMATTSR